MTAVELYRKLRPATLNALIGQDTAIETLKEMGRNDSMPHVLLFTGPSGCGKTTIPRILRKKLKCAAYDFVEVNSASFRGIDTVRDISKQMHMLPMQGPVRIWLMDECHQITGAASDALLKILEDTPPHVYFFLATTNPEKLKKTILTRCTEIKLKALTPAHIIELVERTLIAENKGRNVGRDVIEKIAEAADGSARKAMVILHQIIDIDDEAKQLEIVTQADVKEVAFEIARKLLNTKTTWAQMAKLLKGVDEEPESLRWMILGYANKVLLGGKNNGRAANVIEHFRDNWYDSKKAGLTISCFNVIEPN